MSSPLAASLAPRAPPPQKRGRVTRQGEVPPPPQLSPALAAPAPPVLPPVPSAVVDSGPPEWAAEVVQRVRGLSQHLEQVQVMLQQLQRQKEELDNLGLNPGFYADTFPAEQPTLPQQQAPTLPTLPPQQPPAPPTLPLATDASVNVGALAPPPMSEDRRRQALEDRRRAAAISGRPLDAPPSNDHWTSLVHDLRSEAVDVVPPSKVAPPDDAEYAALEALATELNLLGNRDKKAGIEKDGTADAGVDDGDEENDEEYGIGDAGVDDGGEDDASGGDAGDAEVGDGDGDADDAEVEDGSEDAY